MHTALVLVRLNCCPPPHPSLPPPQLREQYGIAEHMVAFDVVEIINIPGYGSRAAVTLCEAMGVQSQRDTAKLAEAKAEVYLKGFTEGGVCSLPLLMAWSPTTAFACGMPS